MSLWKKDKLKRLNILEGSVRSGKTWISLVLWAFWVSQMPKDKAFLMVAKTLTSLRRNTLDLMSTMFGSNFSYSLPAKEAHLFGRLVYLEGVNDARAESKIRGMTLQGAYCDEITLFTEDFFTMLLSRLSEPGAKLFGTTNPDNPNHWFKTKYLDRKDELDMLVMKFLIDDNEFLDPEYVKQLKAEYTGIFYNRFILGEWVLAEGLIYPQASKARTETQDRAYTEYRISCDYGIYNPTAFGLFGKYKDKWYMVKEYYHSGRESKNPKTDEEYCNDLHTFAGDLPINRIIVDPSASSFITAIKRRGKYRVVPAKNAVLDGIYHTANVMQTDLLKINDCCKHTLKEFDVYSWDEKGGEDKPLKENDHCMDMLRYFVMTIINPNNIRIIKG